MIRYSEELPFGSLAQDLVNSYDVTHSPPEHLRSPADLQSFLERYAIAYGRAATSKDLAAVRAFRQEVRAVFEAPSERAAVRAINALLDTAEPALRLVGGPAPHLQWNTRPVDNLSVMLRSAAAINLAFAAARHGFERLRVCAALPCRDVFVDVSKGGERRFCGVKCATRTRVAAFRARQS